MRNTVFTGHRLRRAARCSRGAAAVEYALLLSIICFMVTGSVATAGKRASLVLYETGEYIGGGSQSTGDINPPGDFDAPPEQRPSGTGGFGNPGPSNPDPEAS